MWIPAPCAFRNRLDRSYPMARMILLQQGAATTFELTEDETIFGRHPECTVQLQSNMISRQHAKVVRRGDGFVLEDLGSGNGSFVNGQRIAAPTILQQDDRIKLGPLLFRFEADGGRPAASDSDHTVVGDGQGVTITTEESGSTIMGTVDDAAGFGMLDVQPQAKLKAVLEISRSLAGTVDLNSLLPKILDTLFEVFPHADRGCILLKDGTTGKMLPRAFKHRRQGDDDSVKLSRTILQQVLEQKKAILSADAASDSRFEASESISSLTIRSMMCVPLLSLDGEPMGVINIDTQNPLAQFRKDDLDIMIAVAGQAALSYESARLLSSYIEKQKQDNEMQIAADVQLALLPAEENLPHVAGYEFFASYESAQAVGGDYYDVFALPDGRTCLAFGDVAGKGVPASLVMSRLSSVVRSTLMHVSNADEAVGQINSHMCDKAVEGRFVTFVLTLLDTERHTMSIVNAGHMSPMVRHLDGTVEELPETATGIPLGVIEGYPYESVEHALAPGDTVVIYTDGVSEAMNPDSDLYTVERIRDLVAASSSRAAELGSAIRADVRKHANGRPQNDDITLMVFGRLPD